LNKGNEQPPVPLRTESTIQQSWSRSKTERNNWCAQLEPNLSKKIWDQRKHMQDCTF